MRDNDYLDGSTSTGRALALLSAIVADGGQSALSEIAARTGIPRASAHRAVQAMERAGYLIRSRRGYYHAGPELAALGPMLDPARIAAGVARPVLAQLAHRYGCLAHCGIFEQDMVTYLLKEGARKDALFTREAMQLEAYCSGLGKVLLAALDDEALESYLANGPFVSLTERTIVEPDALRREIAGVRERGHAIDNCEASDELYCLAVPLLDAEGRTLAAISLSFREREMNPRRRASCLAAIKKAASTIAARMEPSGTMVVANP